MKHNFIFEPSKSYQKQHMLPISPQNFDPLDKSKEEASQKKPIFSSSAKPKTLYESLFEVENSQLKSDDSIGENELKRALAKEMRVQLDGLKTELLENFSSFLRDFRNTGKLSNEEVQEIKDQIMYNKRKFEEIQRHIEHVSQQYNDVSTFCSKELEGLKANSSFSGMSRGDRSGDFSSSNEMTQKQIDAQFRAFKQGLLNDVQNIVKSKGKAKLTDDVVGELRQIKHSFESDLKQNFEMINGRVKRSEENLNEILKKKGDYMDAIRDESLTLIDHQNTALTQEIKHLENVVKSKCEQTQAKAIVGMEINKRMDLFRTETDALRKAISSNQEEIESVGTLVNRKIENMDYDIKRQFFELQTAAQKDSTPQMKQDNVERRLQKLNGDSEGYHKTILQLRNQVDEVTKVHKLLQSQGSMTSSQDIINRLEDKISNLQRQIEELDSQVRRQHQPHKLEDSMRKSLRPKPTELSELQLGQPSVEETEGRHNRAVLSQRIEAGEIREFKAHSPPQGMYEKNGLPEYNLDSIKYHGDPKVKSIIDEFHQKKRQNQISSVDMRKGQREKTLQPETLQDSGSKFNIRNDTGRSASDKVMIKGSPDRQQASLLAPPTIQEGEMVKPQSSPRRESLEQSQQEAKKVKHAKILAQINYFISGTVSSLLDEEEDSEIYCNLDDEGYIFDENNDFVLDSQGRRVKLTEEQIEKFNNNNMIE